MLHFLLPERLGPVARAGDAMGSKKAKTALDEIIAARNAKQSQKSVKQLYIEASGALNPKVRGAPLPLRARVRACGGRVRTCQRTKV